jgi:protein O-GlcNAc transferase
VPPKGCLSKGARADFSPAAEHQRTGTLSEAEALYRAALLAHPHDVDMLQQLAVLCHRTGRDDEALDLFRRVISLNPEASVAGGELGHLLEQQGDLRGATICYRQAVRIAPKDSSAHANLARVLGALGRLAEAIIHYRRALALKPQQPWWQNALGNLLLMQGAVAPAIESYRRALDMMPGLSEAHSNLGEGLRRIGETRAAIDECERALLLKPDLPEAHNNLGNALRDDGRAIEAARHYGEALRLRPGWAEVHNNLAIVFEEQGLTARAIEECERALALKPNLAETRQNLAAVLLQCGRAADAITALQHALVLKPNDPDARVQLAHLNAELCAWRDHPAEVRQVLKLMRRHPGSVPPFNLQMQESTPGEKLLCAQQWSKKIAGGRLPAFAHKRLGRPSRIRLGYLSADFRDHPVAYAITEIVECHDRTQFEVIGYSYGPDDRSLIRRRLQAGFDCFIDLRTVGNDEAAQRIHSDVVDVLIDLTGYTHTRFNRTRILASRPAPIQVNFLGFLGTMGASFIDYIIVDSFIAPPSQQAFYSEKLVHLAGGWWPAEITWDIANDARERHAYGLPEDAFVFCCFTRAIRSRLRCSMSGCACCGRSQVACYGSEPRTASSRKIYGAKLRSRASSIRTGSSLPRASRWPTISPATAMRICSSTRFPITRSGQRITL